MKNIILLLSSAFLMTITGCGNSNSNSGGCTNNFTLNGDGHTNEVFTLKTVQVSYLNGLTIANYSSSSVRYTMINSIIYPYESSLNNKITLNANLPNVALGAHHLINAKNITFAEDSFYMSFDLTDNLGKSYEYYSISGTINIKTVPNCTGGGVSTKSCDIGGEFNNVVLARMDNNGNPIANSYITISNSPFCAQKQF